jgi:hypothetical protein
MQDEPRDLLRQRMVMPNAAVADHEIDIEIAIDKGAGEAGEGVLDAALGQAVDEKGKARAACDHDAGFYLRDASFR